MDKPLNDPLYQIDDMVWLSPTIAADIKESFLKYHRGETEVSVIQYVSADAHQGQPMWLYNMADNDFALFEHEITPVSTPW